MKNTMLSRAIRLLIDNDDCERDENARALLLRHRKTFVDKFNREDAGAESLENVSVEVLVWFMQTIRTKVMLKTWVGMDTWPKKMGFLTFRTITILFDDPKRAFSMEADEFDESFASGRYLRDVKCDFFLAFDALTDQLCAVMIDALGYDRDIVMFLKEHAGRKNTSPEEKKPRVLRELDKGGLLARILEEEEVYEKYLLPLAGTGTRPRNGGCRIITGMNGARDIAEDTGAGRRGR